MQMQRDVQFLIHNHIMDYSLIVGIHDAVKGNVDDIRYMTLSAFEPGAEVSRRHTSENQRQRSRTRSIAKIDSFSSNSEFLSKNPREKQYCIFCEDNGGYGATDEVNIPLKETYYLGIIDIFTKYSAKKQLETFFKGLVMSKVSFD